MTTTVTVSPAYSRDYTSATTAKAEWAAGKDFILHDISSPWDGKPINITDAQEAGFAAVNIRYKQLTKMTTVRVVR